MPDLCDQKVDVGVGGLAGRQAFGRCMSFTPLKPNPPTLNTHTKHETLPKI